MPTSKHPYIQQLLSQLTPAKQEKASGKLIDEIITMYIQQHAQAEGGEWDDSSPEASETNALAYNLGIVISDVFGAPFLAAIHETQEYKDELAQHTYTDEDDEEEEEDETEDE